MACLALNVCVSDRTPISVCEESESTASGRWADIIDSDDESTDISSQDPFMLIRARTESTTQSDAMSTQSSEPCFSSAGMNAEAPEFVPTLSHCCPLTGLIEVIPEDEAGLPNDPAPTSSEERSSVMAFSRVDCQNSLAEGIWSLQASAAPSTKGSRIARRKQRPCKLQVNLCQSLAIADEHTESECAQSHIPPATEEEWERRSETRRRSIEIGKDSEEYNSHLERRAQQQNKLDENEQEPLTPDATDRSISKRRWKYEVAMWRDALKKIHSEASVAAKILSSESMASTEEWQSQATNTTEADEANTVDGDDASLAGEQVSGESCLREGR